MAPKKRSSKGGCIKDEPSLKKSRSMEEFFTLSGKTASESVMLGCAKAVKILEEWLWGAQVVIGLLKPSQQVLLNQV